MRWFALVLALAACHKKHAVELAFAPQCEAPPDRFVDVMRERLEEPGIGIDVSTRGAQLIVELPATADDALVADMQKLVERTAKLEVELVDAGSVYMQHVVEQAANDTRALGAGIAGETEHWQPPIGVGRTDYHLRGPERTTVATYIAELAAADPRFAVPDDRALGAQRTPDGWRSYLLVRGDVLTGAGIADVRGSYSARYDVPLVEVGLTPEGERTFGDISQRVVGGKIAFVLDGDIKSVQLVASQVADHQVTFAMVSRDKLQAERERDDLVAVLRVGALPCGLRAAGVTRR